MALTSGPLPYLSETFFCFFSTNWATSPSYLILWGGWDSNSRPFDYQSNACLNTCCVFPSIYILPYEYCAKIYKIFLISKFSMNFFYLKPHFFFCRFFFAIYSYTFCKNCQKFPIFFLWEFFLGYSIIFSFLHVGCQVGNAPT